MLHLLVQLQPLQRGPQAQADSAEVPARSVYNQFLDALEFGDYKESKPHKSLCDSRFITGPLKDSITLGWCIKNAACGSPLLIKKFMALNTDLDDAQQDQLNFLAYIAEKGKPKLTLGTMLRNKPPLPFQDNGIFDLFIHNPFAFHSLSLPHGLIYKILLYTQYFSSAYLYIESRELTIEHPLEK